MKKCVRIQTQLKKNDVPLLSEDDTLAKYNITYVKGDLVMEKIGGDKITAIDSSVVSKSSFSNAINNVRIKGNADVAKAIEDLAEIIGSSNLKDKKETLENIESLAEEAAKPNPKKGTLRTLGESILNTVQKVPDIVEKVAPLIKIISKLWL